MPRVTFSPSGRCFDVARGSTLFKAAVRGRMPLARSCRGTAVCGDCRVRIVDGEEHLAPMSVDEKRLAARLPLAPHERYACCAHCFGPVTVTTKYW